MSSITLTINAGCVGELQMELQNLLVGGVLKHLAEEQTRVPPAVLAEVAEANVEAAASPSPEPEAKKERKPRAKKADVAVATPETPAEVKAQDEADEKAEQTLAKAAELTRDDVRIAFSKYVIDYGLIAAEIDIKELLKRVYPDGKVLSLTKIPETQEDFAKVIAGAKEMLEKNPFKREKIPQETVSEEDVDGEDVD